MRRAFLIVNPFASSVSERNLSDVQAALAPFAEVTTVQTQRPRHGSELAMEAERDGCDAIFVFSGDGGFNEVLNGVESSELPLGFIPGGGTSVLPRALGLPRTPLEAATRLGEALAQGRTRRISLGRANGRRFGFNAGVGIDAETVRRFDALGRREDGHRPGDLRFALTLAKVVVDRRGRYEPVAEIDGVGRVAFALVANTETYTYAGSVPIRIAPRARFELGLDVVAALEIGPRSLLGLTSAVLLGRTDRARGVAYLHDVDRVEVRADRPLPLQADGEDLGDVDHVVFECERRAATVLV